MSSKQDFVDYVLDQIKSAGTITYRKMFGEYAIYAEGKVVALVCDDRLFIKPTEAGKSYIGKVTEAPPYPGAKLYFLIEDQLEDGEWLSRLIGITEKALPEPKPKKRKGKSKKK